MIHEDQLLSTVIRTSGYWRAYFESNARSLRPIPWRAGPELTLAERQAIAASVQGFQRGESSTGSRLLGYARRYARRSGDVEYVLALQLFIAEEQRHARDLGRFLELAGIPLTRSNPLDRVFRLMRHTLGTLEVAISVLLTAEIVAKVYYRALGRATGSTVLRALCDQILHDERQHVVFQSEQLGKLQSSRGAVWLFATNVVRRLLFHGTCVVVWLCHRRALRQGRLSFARFWRDCRRELKRSMASTLGVREAVRLRSRLTGDEGPARAY